MDGSSGEPGWWFVARRLLIFAALGGVCVLGWLLIALVVWTILEGWL